MKTRLSHTNGSAAVRPIEQPFQEAEIRRAPDHADEAAVQTANRMPLDPEARFRTTLFGGRKREYHENEQMFAEYDALLKQAARAIAMSPVLLRELEKIRASSNRDSSKRVNFENRAVELEAARGTSELDDARDKARRAVMRFRPTLNDLRDVGDNVEALVNDLKNDFSINLRCALASWVNGMRKDEAALRDLAGEITLANSGLVYTAAPKYEHRGLTGEDVRQEGLLGLFEGVQRFIPSRGYQLSTYAPWWVRQKIERAIQDQSRIIRIPVHMADTMAKVNRIEQELLGESGALPTPEEIADASGLPIERVRTALKYRNRVESLDAPISEDGATKGDFVEDTSTLSPDKAAGANQAYKELAVVMDGLTAREREIIERRFGMNGRPEQTLEEVGQIFHVTRERIRQIESKALRKLRRWVARAGGEAAFNES